MIFLENIFRESVTVVASIESICTESNHHQVSAGFSNRFDGYVYVYVRVQVRDCSRIH